MTTQLLIKEGALTHVGELLGDYSQLAVISSAPLFELFPLVPGHRITVPDGEAAKSLSVAEQCWQQLYLLGLDRNSSILALGGGSVGDLAGWVASTFMRGVDFVQLPTTLLAMVDASHGGKTAINLGGIKNAIGTFHLPRQVIIDPAALDSLPEEHYRSGMAEVIKAAVLDDATLFEQLEEGTETQMIERAIAVKQRIVHKDLRDRGHRALLNYGHTFAHALEKASGLTLPHGYAVSIGMSCAAHLTETDGPFARRQDSLCKAMGLPTELPDLDERAILKAMGQDKKRRGGKMRLVLAKELGNVWVEEVEPERVEEVLRWKR